jgi:hypothetical protein
MMAMHKELVVSLADLRYVSISCPQCRTKVILDMKEPSERVNKQGIFAPKSCPGCLNSYDTAIQPSVDAFQRVYAALSAIAERVSFRGEIESAELNVSGRASDSKV